MNPTPSALRSASSSASSPGVARDDSRERLDRLSDLAERLLARARALGASQAEVDCSEDRGLEVSARLGQVETIESTRDRSIGITVYFGHRKGSASTADLREQSLEATVAQACAIARHTEDDPAAGLADPERMARPGTDGDWPEFDQWHPWALDAERAVDLAIACETAGREADARIANSEGAGVSVNESIAVYANSHGFLGRERSTRHQIYCSLIAGEREGMQGDSWHTYGVAADDLEAPEAVGRKAAERTVSRLGSRSLGTGSMPVLFAPEVARSLIGHLLQATAGGSLYRRSSFLLDRLGQRILPPWFSIRERPFLRRGLQSGNYDAEGVAARESALVEDGVLARYTLSSYTARKLGLETTGNAGGMFNLEIGANAEGLEAMARAMGDGLLVVELMGHGVNIVTGDYSRGAAGFRVEKGEIAYPVSGITIAGRLPEMFQRIEAVGADIDPRSSIRCGSLLVGEMTVAGEG